jgi:hypothetical protein
MRAAERLDIHRDARANTPAGKRLEEMRRFFEFIHQDATLVPAPLAFRAFGE